MKDAKLKRAVAIVDGSMSAFQKFTDSITKEEILKAKETMADSVSAEILATMTVMLVLQALVVDDHISENKYKALLAELCLDEPTSIGAVKVMEVIHMQRLNGEDYFNGKEI